MKLGAAISGGVHLTLIAIALFGVDWFRDREDEPLTVTEIEFVDGTEFEAALSTAPFVPTDEPRELTRPGEGQPAPENVETPEDAAETAPAPVLSEVPTPDPRPKPPEIAFNTPVNVPTEAPKPSIAEIPSPDLMNREAATPESPPSTEPVQPLASIEAPSPQAKPTPPPQPEPEPEETERTAEVSAPSPDAETEPTPDPETTQEPSPDSVAEEQPEAPQGLAPQQAMLPVAKPADLAAAAEAARKAELAAAEETEPEKPERVANATTAEKPETRPAERTGGSTPRRGPKLNRGEINALRLGIKKYYTYTGSRSDPSLRVKVRVELSEDGEIVGKPKILDGSGGTAGDRRALGQAGSRALLRAARDGEFRRLPREKYGRWKRLNFIFTIDRLDLSG